MSPLIPVFLSYVLSFIYVAIYWNNHHHLLHSVSHMNSKTMWANHHLLFWLSLIPFVTKWAGDNHFEPMPVALYGIVLMMAGVAFTILTKVLVRHHGAESPLSQVIGTNLKGKLSDFAYLAAIAIAFWTPEISCFIYVVVAIVWFMPDKRLEKIFRT